MKAARLFLVTILYLVVAVFYAPVIALYVASWPFRMVGWSLKSLGELTVKLQNVLRRLARTQTAYAYGYNNLQAYDAHVAEEAARMRAEFEAGLAAGRARAAAAAGAVPSTL